MSKAEVDRDPPPLFLLQSVGINARQRLYQRRLPVIDVPSRAHHN
jgi:hypothetical protein